MDPRYTIAYNITIKDVVEDHVDVIFLRNKFQYNLLTSKYPDKIIEYVPDTRFLLWSRDISKNDATDTVLLIMIKNDNISKKLKKLIETISPQYNVKYGDTDRFEDEDYIKSNIGNSDLVICQNYLTHLACIIYEKPFISVSANADTEDLLKDIHIDKLRYVKCKKITYLLNNWIEYRKLIREYNKRNIEYIKLKFDKYNISYGQ